MSSHRDLPAAPDAADGLRPGGPEDAARAGSGSGLAFLTAVQYLRLERTYRWARRAAVAVMGTTVLAAGLVMVVLPGPAVVVIPLGLGILGLEFAWARRWLRVLRERSQALVDSYRGGR